MGVGVTQGRRSSTLVAAMAAVISIGIAVVGWISLDQRHMAPDGTKCGSVLAGFEGGTYVDDGRVLPCSDLPVFSYRWGWPMFLGGIALTLVTVAVLAVRSQREPLT